MCRAVTCRTCGKTTWAGCGLHVDSVMSRVPSDERCEGHERRGGSRPARQAPRPLRPPRPERRGACEVAAPRLAGTPGSAGGVDEHDAARRRRAHRRQRPAGRREPERLAGREEVGEVEPPAHDVVEQPGVVGRRHAVAAEHVELPADDALHRHVDAARRPAAAAPPARAARAGRATGCRCGTPRATPGRRCSRPRHRPTRPSRPRRRASPPIDASTTSSAPLNSARSSDAADTSTAHTRAPRLRATATAASPTPPAPDDDDALPAGHAAPARRPPGRPWRRGTRARPPGAASRPSGSATRLVAAAWTTTSSANDPGSVKPGWRCRGQTWPSPAQAHRALPHAMTKGAVTRAPQPPGIHLLADRLDDPGELVAGHVRERRDVAVVPHPAVPVAAAQPARDAPARRPHPAARRGRGRSATSRGRAERGVGQGSHAPSLPPAVGCRARPGRRQPVT